MKKLVGLMICWAMAGALNAQEREIPFPVPVLPGERFTVPSNLDTLWLLKHAQYKRALKLAKKSEIDSTMVALLEQKQALLSEIITQKDSIIALQRAGYVHYRELWDKTDRELEAVEIQNGKLKRSRILFALVGAALGATAIKVV
ncbi:hypothetical protein HUU05_23530 [candidate division KSB1 bacterium]|nr:hypothetical protein [candidate division KSB1 bacterium]